MTGSRGVFTWQDTVPGAIDRAFFEEVSRAILAADGSRRTGAGSSSECACGFGNLTGNLIHYSFARKRLRNAAHIAKRLILATACPSDLPLTARSKVANPHSHRW